VILEIDPTSPVPPFEQIRVQIDALVEGGGLVEGARLPTIRQLAGDLGLATGTSKVRHGTTVARRPKTTARQAEQRLAAAARGYAQAVRALGVDGACAIAAIEQALTELRG
jgi:GntR family transcriptional regulator